MPEEAVNEVTLNSLLEISRKIISTLDIDRVDEVILKEAMHLLDKEYGALFMLDEQSGHLALVAARGFNENDSGNLKILGAWEAINQAVLKSPEFIIINEADGGPFHSSVSMRLEAENNTVGVLTLSNKNSSPSFTLNQQKILEILANYAAVALVNAKLYKESEDLFISLISSLVAAIDAKDPYTAGHSQRVTNIALSIAGELNLSREPMKNLKLSAILHDIGKIGISELILSKPAKLSPEERELIKRHPEIGVKIVNSIPHSERFIRGIGEHHEFYNGQGYPQGLEKEGISLEGRIIAVADVFDALTSDRAYRKGMSFNDACEKIKQGAGIHFDPDVVEAYLRVYEKNPNVFSS
ncbi:MAG: HD-GYP domain-containing protein [Candidatus Omnitrophota bacterium]